MDEEWVVVFNGIIIHRDNTKRNCQNWMVDFMRNMPYNQPRTMSKEHYEKFHAKHENGVLETTRVLTGKIAEKV